MVRCVRATTFAVISLMAISGAPCQDPGARVSYLVEVIDPSAHHVRVTVLLSGFSGPAVSLALSQDIDINAIRAVATSRGVGVMAGAGLEIKRDGGLFRLGLPEGGDAEITYDLTMNQWKKTPGLGPRGYLCDGYLLSSVQWTLLVPVDTPVARFAVRFKLPAGWKAIAPWQASGDVFEETDATLFREATFAAGRFEERSRMIGGTLVRVAVDLNHEEAFRARLSEQSFQIFSTLKNLFAATGLPVHLSIFVKPEGASEWQFLNEHGSSQGEAVTDLRSAAYQYAHRVFHSFNAFYPAGMAVQPTWFLEGVNEYYCRIAMATSRVEAPFSGLREMYTGVYLPLRTRYDGPLSGNLRFAGDYPREDFLAYKKGALVAALLDRRILQASSGKRSLADVLKSLYARYGAFRGGELIEAAIEAEASRVAGADLKPFFDAYIRGSTALAMDAIFSDDDLDGICAMGEDWLGTNASLSDSDGDLASDLYEFSNRSNPLDPSDKPAGTVFIDGFGPEWVRAQAQVKGPVSVAVVGQIVYVMLSFPNTSTLAAGGTSLRWYLNVDTNGDYAPDLHFAALPGTPGDWSKFSTGNITYDYRAMTTGIPLDSAPSSLLASAVAQVAEFRIPRELLGNNTPLRLSAGIWDTTSGNARASVDWVEFQLPGLWGGIFFRNPVIDQEVTIMK